MAPIVLDTDAASLIMKNRLPATLAAKLVGTQSGVSFVTLGELTKWAVIRDLGVAPSRCTRPLAGRASGPAMYR